MDDEKQQSLVHTYDAISSVVFNKNYNDLTSTEKDIIKQMYEIQKISFASSIYKKDIYLALANITGVQSVVNVDIYNKYGESEGYSKYTYNIEDATYNEVIYPSLDPSVFEIKNPDRDIKGKVVPL